VRDKLELTHVLVSQLPDHRRITADQARRTWWVNIRRTGGLRLTDQGYAALVMDLDIERYEVAISDPARFQQRLILKMDRKLKMPYYVLFEKRIPRKVMFFGSREAMLARLYGDLERFLEFYS
jgi:hypothetical protein